MKLEFQSTLMVENSVNKLDILVKINAHQLLKLRI